MIVLYLWIINHICYPVFWYITVLDLSAYIKDWMVNCCNYIYNNRTVTSFPLASMLDSGTHLVHTYHEYNYILGPITATQINPRCTFLFIFNLHPGHGQICQLWDLEAYCSKTIILELDEYCSESHISADISTSV